MNKMKYFIIAILLTYSCNNSNNDSFDATKRLFDNHQYKRIIEQFESNKIEKTNDVKVFCLIIDSYIHLNKIENAISLINKRRDLFDLSNDVKLKLATLLRLKKEYNNALEICNNLLKKDPFFNNAYIERGYCYFAIGDYNSAVNDLKISYDMKKDSIPVINLLAACYYKLGMSKAAIYYYKQALKLTDINAEIYFNLACVYYSINDTQNTRISFDRAIKGSPFDTNYYFSRGVFYMNINKNKEALDDLEKATKLGSKNATPILENLKKM